MRLFRRTGAEFHPSFERPNELSLLSAAVTCLLGAGLLLWALYEFGLKKYVQ